MQKIFAKNVFLLVIINLLIKPFWIFGIDRNVQLMLGNDIYGAYYSFFNLTLIFQIIMDMGLHTYNNNMIAKQPATISKTLPNILVAKAILTLVYYLILLIIGIAFDYSSPKILLLLAIGTIQVANSYMLFLRGNVAALQLFQYDRWLSILDRLLIILTLSGFIFLPYLQPNLSLKLFISVQIISMLIVAIMGYGICAKSRNIKWNNIRIKRIMGIIQKGIPYAALVFCMGIYTRIDGFMIDTLSTTTNAGIYAKSFRLLDIANNMSGVLVASILLPLFAKIIAKKENLSTITTIAEMILLPFSISVAAITFFFSNIICTWIYGTADLDVTASLLSYTILLLPLFSINYIYSTLLTASGAIVNMIKIALTGSLISLFLNYLALNYYYDYGLIAVAIANIITHLIVTVLFFISTNKKFNTAQNSMLLKVKFLIFLCCILLVGWIITYQYEQTLGALIIYGCIIVFLTLAFKIFDVKRVINEFKLK